MKRVVALLVFAACGPTVGVDGSAEDVDDTGVATTSGGTVTITTTSAGATSVSTDPTSATATDPTTSDPDTTGLVDSGDVTADPGTFIMTPDGALVGLECDVWAQDCARGTKCVPANTGGTDWFSGTKCAPVADDPAAVGEPCTVQDDAWSGLDDCELGSVCWFFDESLEGSCASQCTGSRASPMCPPGHACEVGAEGNVTLCLSSCDPLAPACGRGRTCMHGERAGDGGFGHFVCQTQAPLFEIAGYGAECDHYGHSCDEGLACVWPANVPDCMGAGCCTTLGTLTTPPACPDATQSCIAAYPDGDAPEGLEDLCYCGVES